MSPCCFFHCRTHAAETAPAKPRSKLPHILPFKTKSPTRLSHDKLSRNPQITQLIARCAHLYLSAARSCWQFIRTSLPSFRPPSRCRQFPACSPTPLCVSISISATVLRMAPPSSPTTAFAAPRPRPRCRPRCRPRAMVGLSKFSLFEYSANTVISRI
jgi:hypothetical protein